MLHAADNGVASYGFRLGFFVVLCVVPKVVLAVAVVFCVARVETEVLIVVLCGAFVTASGCAGVRSLHRADAGQSHKFPFSCQCKPPAQLLSENEKVSKYNKLKYERGKHKM